MKRFCFLTSASRNYQFVILKRQAHTLMDNGFDVFFCVSDDGKSEVVNGIHYLPNGYSGGGYIKRLLTLARLMYKTAATVDADVYQIESPDLLRVGLKLKRKGKKVIFNLMEGYPFNFYKKTKLPHWIARMFVSVMSIHMKRALRNFDVVFAVSQDIMDYLGNWGLENAVLLGNFPEINKNYHLNKEDYLNRDDRVIYYGHIPETSYQENVICAINKIPGVKYLLAGKFWSNNYKNRLALTDGWEKVEFIDGFDRNQLPSILSRCTISNTARDLSGEKSSNGSLGIIKIFESMEAALPVILVDVPVYRQLVDEYHCGLLVDIHNVDSIKDAIQFLVSHKEEAYEMGQNGRKAVLEKYSWDQISKVYLSHICAQ